LFDKILHVSIIGVAENKAGFGYRVSFFILLQGLFYSKSQSPDARGESYSRPANEYTPHTEDPNIYKWKSKGPSPLLIDCSTPPTPIPGGSQFLPFRSCLSVVGWVIYVRVHHLAVLSNIHSASSSVDHLTLLDAAAL
jgi:hypothetical protein